MTEMTDEKLRQHLVKLAKEGRPFSERSSVGRGERLQEILAISEVRELCQNLLTTGYKAPELNKIFTEAGLKCSSSTFYRHLTNAGIEY